MDMRSADQAAQVLATGDIAVEVNSGGKGPVSAEWMIGKALWIKQNEPELYKVGDGGVCPYCFLSYRPCILSQCQPEVTNIPSTAVSAVMSK